MITDIEKKQTVEKFVTWIATKEACIAGPVFNPLLGTYNLCELHPYDLPQMISDFIKESAA